MAAPRQSPHLPLARWLAGAGALLWQLGWGTPAHAESLRCAGGIAAEGDSRLSLLAKCGQPVLADSYCAPVYLGRNHYPVPEPWASRAVPCQQVDEWLYDRGPGNLWATVRLRSGVVLSITYGSAPR
jgi:hypothetical protein